MSVQEIIVALLRGVQVTALLSLFGTTVFMLAVAPGGTDQPELRRQLLRIARVSAICGMVGGFAWLVVESGVLAGTAGITGTLQAFPIVASQTQFGRWLLLRLMLLAVILTLARGRGRPLAAALLSAIALAIEAMIGHAGAIGGMLIASEMLHLLAAGAWLGGLLPLLVSVRVLPAQEAAVACRGFTPVGLSAVLVLGGTAVVQVTELVGGIPGLFGTTYGDVALIKLSVFVVLLTLAGLNRFVLTERVERISPRAMRASVASEAVLGLLVVIAAGFLASLTPGTHEQPVWPFAWRPSLVAMTDAELRREVIIALGVLLAGIAVGVTALAWRRIRWLGLAVGAVMIALSVPHLDLLFVPAYPTSFFTSPTEFAATAIVHGARLFAEDCTPCHGAEGHGDGPAAASLPWHPADLTAEHLWAHSDGELYWYLSHGFPAPDGSLAMPGFADHLSSEARWDLIDYLHAHNAGYSMHTLGRWTQPVRVPQFDATCADGSVIDLDDLRGRMLLLTAGEEVPLPDLPSDIARVALARHHTRPSGPVCVANEPQSWSAFAILLGTDDAALDGAVIVADRNHWLRAAWRGEIDKTALQASIRDFAAHPLSAPAAVGHVH
jgi:putative copper export protein/mono/diheme cytochrome c family protein